MCDDCGGMYCVCIRYTGNCPTVRVMLINLISVAKLYIIYVSIINNKNIVIIINIINNTIVIIIVIIIIIIIIVNITIIINIIDFTLEFVRTVRAKPRRDVRIRFNVKQSQGGKQRHFPLHLSALVIRKTEINVSLHKRVD